MVGDDVATTSGRAVIVDAARGTELARAGASTEERRRADRRTRRRSAAYRVRRIRCAQPAAGAPLSPHTS